MNSSVPKQPVATSDSCSNSHWLLAVGLGSAIGNGCRPGFGLGSAYVRPTFGLGSAWVDLFLPAICLKFSCVWLTFD